MATINDRVIALKNIATQLNSTVSAQALTIASLRGRIEVLEADNGTPAPLTITGTPPSNGRVGDSYSFAPQTAGGSGTRTYSLAGGSLLSGLMLSTATGAITGTPTLDGIITGLSVRVSDATGSAATVPGNVTIASIPVSISGTPPTTGAVGQAYSFMPTVSNGKGTKTYALTGGTLLGGLSFSTVTGGITGTPNVVGTMTGIMVRVTDDTGSASTTATNVVIAEAGSGVVLEPNPGGGTTSVAGPVASLPPTDTASTVNFIEARMTGTETAGSGAGAGLTDDGNGYRIFRFISGTSFQGTRRNPDGSLDDANALPKNQLFPQDSIPVIGWKIRMDRTVDKIVHTIIDPDGTSYEIYAEDAANGSVFFGTKVVLLPSNGVLYSDIIYGGAAVPLRVDNQVLTAGYKPQARLLYTGDPGAAGYQCRIRSAGGSTLVDWTDAVLTNASKGAVTATAATGVPTSEFGQNVRIDWRQKNLPSVTQTKLEAMPAGKAKIGMNLTLPGHANAERIFKNLLIANDGWRSGGNYLNPTSNPTLFNSNGDLIASGGFQPRQAFGRGNFTGRYRAEWEGGDSPLTDMALAGGESVSFSNVTAGSRFIEFDYNFSWNTPGSFGYLEQKGFYPSNPIRNIRVSEVGTDYSTGVFDDTFIARASVYDYARLMDWMGSNAANYISENQPWLLEWTNRTLPSTNQFGYTGFPLEYIIEFANRSGCDIWIMTPAGASPDYQVKIIRALFYGEGMLAFGATPAGRALNNTTTVYDELGNEWFNSQFSIWQSAVVAARNFGRAPEGTGNNEARINEMVYRMKTHWTAIEGQFPAGRLKKMFMGNPSDTYDAENMHLQGADDYDIGGCAFYTMNVKFEDQPNLWPGQNLQALFDFANATIPTGLATLKSNRNYSTGLGKGFWVYEGNPSHWLELRGTQPYADQAFFTTFQQDARMEDTTTRWFDAFTSNIAGGLTCYAAFGEPSVLFGSWGFTANQGDTTLAKSPKQRALLSAVQRLNA